MNRMVVVLFAIFASTLYAGEFDVCWTGDDSHGYWDDASCWKEGVDSKGWGVPGMIKKGQTWNHNAGFARIENGVVVVNKKHQPNGRVERVYLGGVNGATLYVDGGSLKCHKFFTGFDKGSVAKFEINGGTLFCDAYTCLGEGFNSKTEFNINGGIYEANNHVYCPMSKVQGSNVEINVDGGDFIIDENIYLGNKAGTFTVLNLKSGKIQHNGGNFGVAFGGKAVFNQTGGEIITNSYDRIRVGWKSGAYGEIRLAGGKFLVNKELALHRGVLKIDGTKPSEIFVSKLRCMNGKEEAVEFVFDSKGVTPIKVYGEDGADLDDSTLIISGGKDFKPEVGDEIPLIYAKKFVKDKTFKFKNQIERLDLEYSIGEYEGSKCLKIKVVGIKE